MERVTRTQRLCRCAYLCDAVKLICGFQTNKRCSLHFVWKSVFTVCCSPNDPSMYLCSRHVLPTSDLPRITTFKSTDIFSQFQNFQFFLFDLNLLNLLIKQFKRNYSEYECSWDFGAAGSALDWRSIGPWFESEKSQICFLSFFVVQKMKRFA